MEDKHEIEIELNRSNTQIASAVANVLGISLSQLVKYCLTGSTNPILLEARVDKINI